MNKYKKWFVLLGIFTFSLILFSQFSLAKPSISGTIKDSQTKEALPGAIVMLYASQKCPPEGTVKYGSYSTADGRFDIEVEGGTYALAVHLIGYKPFCQLIPIEGETTIDIELEQEPITLEPVVVLPAAYFTVTPSAVKVGEEVTASAKFNYDFDHARIFIDGMKEIYGGPCEISRDNIRKNEQLSVTCKATEAGEYKAILVIQRGGEEKREEEFITVGEKEAKAVIHAKVLGVNKNTASYIYYFPLQYYDWDKDCYKAYFEGGEEIEIYSGAYIQFYPDGSTIEKFGEISPVASDDIEWYFWVSEDDYSYEEKRLEWPEKYTPIKDFRPFKRFFYDASKDIAGYNEFYVVLKVGEWPNEDYNAIKIRVYPRFKQEKAKPVEKPEEKEGLGEEGEECSDEKPCASGLTCYFGRCMPEKIEEWQCIESDGMPKIFDQGKYIENPLYNNPNVPAVCIDFERHADECVSNSEVKEYGCKDGTCQPVIKKCPEGKICRDGRCVSRGEAVAVVKEGGIVKVNGCKILELKYTQVDSETFDANFEITKQKRKVLPKDAKVNGKEKMEMFLKEVSPLLIEEYKKYILDKERDARLYPGGCIAISNLVVKLMQDYGIDAYVADGEFFKPGEGWLTHNFVVLNIDGMEYIVDYTANQFTLPIEYEEIDSETVMKIKEGTDESKYDIIPVIIPIDKGENCNKEYTYKITTIIHKKPTEQDLEEHNVAELYRRIKDMLATKRMEKYSNDMVFLVSDEDWRRVLKLIPLVIWQKNKEECNTLVFSDPEIYESIIEKCAYPLLIYHKEGENFDIESINHFIEQYKGKKIVIADNINTLPANLLSELTISGASKIESMDNYMSYWKNPRKIVYVEDNYKLALIASVYASLINAPLIIAGERIDLNNKYVICVGDVSTRCNERYSLEELQKKYIELTKTSRLILVNPNDIDDRYCVNERLGNVNRLYCHDSLAAPLLAAAKNELIIFTDNSDADSIREDVHNKIADLFGSYTNIKYFTTIASPPAIRLSKYVLERVIGISLFKQYNSLERIVLNFDDDITEEIPFGRIFGITISDTSSYIMRSVFYKKLYEDIYSYRKPSILSIAHSFDPPQFFQPLLAHEIEKLGQYEFTCYVGKKEFSRGVCKVSTSPRLSEYKMKNIILFSNHGNTNLWGSTLSSKEMPWFDLSLGIADACLTISYPRAKEKKSLFGANFIRKGGIGYYGTLTESLATTLNIVEVNEVTSYNFLHSLLESGSSLGVILKREVERNPQEINKMTTILLGDPTLKLDLPVIDLFYYPDLTNYVGRCRDVILTFKNKEYDEFLKPFISAILGKCYYELGDKREAFEYYLDIIDSVPAIKEEFCNLLCESGEDGIKNTEILFDIALYAKGEKRIRALDIIAKYPCYAFQYIYRIITLSKDENPEIRKKTTKLLINIIDRFGVTIEIYDTLIYTLIKMINDKDSDVCSMAALAVHEHYVPINLITEKTKAFIDLLPRKDTCLQFKRWIIGKEIYDALKANIQLPNEYYEKLDNNIVAIFDSTKDENEKIYAGLVILQRDTITQDKKEEVIKELSSLLPRATARSSDILIDLTAELSKYTELDTTQYILSLLDSGNIHLASELLKGRELKKEEKESITTKLLEMIDTGTIYDILPAINLLGKIEANEERVVNKLIPYLDPEYVDKIVEKRASPTADIIEKTIYPQLILSSAKDTLSTIGTSAYPALREEFLTSSGTKKANIMETVAKIIDKWRYNDELINRIASDMIDIIKTTTDYENIYFASKILRKIKLVLEKEFCKRYDPGVALILLDAKNARDISQELKLTLTEIAGSLVCKSSEVRAIMDHILVDEDIVKISLINGLSTSFFDWNKNMDITREVVTKMGIVLSEDNADVKTAVLDFFSVLYCYEMVLCKVSSQLKNSKQEFISMLESPFETLVASDIVILGRLLSCDYFSNKEKQAILDKGLDVLSTTSSAYVKKKIFERLLVNYPPKDYLKRIIPLLVDRDSEVRVYAEREIKMAIRAGLCEMLKKEYEKLGKGDLKIKLEELIRGRC